MSLGEPLRLTNDRIILSLCDYTGIWSQPYKDAGYQVLKVDLKEGQDVRLLEYPGAVHGIIAQPPCTHLAGSGARWWARKGEGALLEAMSIVDACLRFVVICDPEWWVLENPVGRLSKFLGEPFLTYQPHEYAGWADDPDLEAYTKRTCLWGGFNVPEKKDVGNQLGTIMTSGSKKPLKKKIQGIGIKGKFKQGDIRSVTPQGFARAFFAANP